VITGTDIRIESVGIIAIIPELVRWLARLEDRTSIAEIVVPAIIRGIIVAGGPIIRVVIRPPTETGPADDYCSMKVIIVPMVPISTAMKLIMKIAAVERCDPAGAGAAVKAVYVAGEERAASSSSCAAATKSPHAASHRGATRYSGAATATRATAETPAVRTSASEGAGAEAAAVRAAAAKATAPKAAAAKAAAGTTRVRNIYYERACDQKRYCGR
jgi:hypothetical protein